MRLFVALDLEEEVCAALRALLEELKPAAENVRWVRPEGTHLTLKFIGHVREETLESIQRALRAVPCPAPLELAVSGVGFFPNERAPRVVWVGVRADDALALLAAAIETALEPLGIARERRAFHPHLTLGRFREPRRPARLLERIAALPTLEFGRQRAEEFCLFESKLSPRGAEYAKLERFPFSRS